MLRDKDRVPWPQGDGPSPRAVPPYSPADIAFLPPSLWIAVEQVLVARHPFECAWEWQHYPPSTPRVETQPPAHGWLTVERILRFANARVPIGSYFRSEAIKARNRTSVLKRPYIP